MVNIANNKLSELEDAKGIGSIQWIQEYSQEIIELKENMSIDEARFAVAESSSLFRDIFLKGLDKIENNTLSNTTMQDALENATTVSKANQVLDLEIPNISFMTIEFGKNNEPIFDITDIPNFKETEIFIEWFIQHCNKYDIQEAYIKWILHRVFHYTERPGEYAKNLLQYNKTDIQKVVNNLLSARFDATIDALFFNNPSKDRFSSQEIKKMQTQTNSGVWKEFYN